jgi:hypothetical protein
MEGIRARIDAELAADSSSGGVVALRKDAVRVTALVFTHPGNNEVAVAVRSNRRVPLIASGVCVDAKLAAQCHARSAKSLGVDTCRTGILRSTAPGHHEVARCIHGHGSIVLPIRRVRVYPELPSLCLAGGVVSLGEDAETVPITSSFPGDDKIAAGVHGDGGPALVAGCVCVDAELTSQSSTGGTVPLGINAIAPAVLPGAVPDDYIVAVAVRCHGRTGLPTRRVRVDPELRPHGRGRQQRPRFQRLHAGGDG